jgi:hypothetical protein
MTRKTLFERMSEIARDPMLQRTPPLHLSIPDGTPAISLWQPFASLLFAEEPFRKLHETRGFRLPPGRVGRRHAIHASASFPAPRLISGDLHRLCVEVFGWEYRHSLPLGKIIGSVVFADSRPTEERGPATDADRAAGDWSPERWSWRAEEPIKLASPFPMKGRQGWFEVRK